MQYGVPDGGEHKFDVVGVGGAGEMRVDGLVGLAIELKEAVEDVHFHILAVVVRACV